MSVGSYFLSDYILDNYWINTRNTTLAIKYAKKHDLSKLLIDEEASVSLPELNKFDLYGFALNSSVSRQTTLALLYFTGYLTIKDVEEDMLNLDFPNIEVRKSFTSSLLRLYVKSSVDILAIDIRNAGRKGNIPLLMEMINKLYLNIPYIYYRDGSKKEFQEKLHALLLLTSDYIPRSEEMTSSGRIDNVLCNRVKGR